MPYPPNLLILFPYFEKYMKYSQSEKISELNPDNLAIRMKKNIKKQMRMSSQYSDSLSNLEEVIQISPNETQQSTKTQQKPRISIGTRRQNEEKFKRTNPQPEEPKRKISIGTNRHT